MKVDSAHCVTFPVVRSICRNIVELSEKMTELATQPAEHDGRDIQSELEQLTDELQREQLELKRIKTIVPYVQL